jgi:HAD superfamily hydrolase (TIGR01509 family)
VPGVPAEDGGGASGEHDGKMNDRWNIEAVLLDMDGTLLDTAKVYCESLLAALTGLGYTDGIAALCHSMVGIPGPECEVMLLAHYGKDFPLADLNRAFGASVDDLLKQGLPLKNGAVELLDALQEAQCPMAIVTSSSRRTADRHLTLAGIRARFETVLTRDDVARGKPNPDLFVLAAARLGIEPEACMAVEDSNPGVTAAHAAGAITIMVPDIVPPSDESRAKCAAVLPDLKAVLELLRTRGGLKRPSS